MRTLPTDGGISTSVWIDADVPQFDAHHLEPETDVCIIGAGIAGLTTAFELVRRGTRVTVIDDGPIGGGETGRTTAHLASAVDDRFYNLEHRFGPRGASLVAESHQTAIDYIEAVAQERGIACELKRVDGYLISPPGDRHDRGRELERELAAAQRAGMDCELVDRAPLPFETGVALRFASQAQFHPIKYLRGLAQAVVDLGGNIHTGMHVHRIDPGQPLQLHLDGGRSIVARVAVDATNGAFTSPLKLPLRQAAYRTYVVAFRIPTGSIPYALYWDTADPYHYLRLTHDELGRDLLIVGGNDHRTGHGHPAQQWAELERWTRARIPTVEKLVAHWSGQIIEPADGLANIGKSPDLEHVYLCTGDSGNGLTHGTIAGLLLPELMRGRHHRWASIYDPRRSRLRAVGTLLKEAARSSVPYADWLLPGDVSSVHDVPAGAGAIVRRGLQLVACYRDASGTAHERSATCPHLHGVVQWNQAEKTWDCPCHGSRFDRYGRVLNGPAPVDLAELPEPRGRKPAEERREDRKERNEREVPLPFGVAPIIRE